MIATVFVSVAIDLLAKVIPAYTGDQMLAALFGGILEDWTFAGIYPRRDNRRFGFSSQIAWQTAAQFVYG